MNPQVFTYADAVADLEEFCREASISAAGRSIRSSVRRAYREIVEAHDWSSLHVNGRIQLQEFQDTGMVAYDSTGGTYERQLTLSDATWPTAAEDWAVAIDTGDAWIVCDIESRKSATVVTLDATMCPVADVTAGAEYVVYPRYYRLPNDFLSLDRPVEEALDTVGLYITPERMLELTRYYTNESGDIQYFTIAPVADLYGAMGLYVYPYSDTTRTLDFIYKRRPRELRYVGTDISESPGTITATLGSSSIAGNTTSFAADHVGSLLRIGTSATRLPGGLDSVTPHTPYSEQRTITTYTSATAITVDAAVSATHTGVKYSITDPIDLDPPVYDAMLALAKKYLAMEKNAKNWQSLEKLADQRLFRAKCADCRVFTRQAAGVEFTPEPRLSDSPTANRAEVA